MNIHFEGGASLIYKATGHLRAVQILLGHCKIENTIRYPGVDIDDASTLSERTEIWLCLALPPPQESRSRQLNERKVLGTRPEL